MSAVAPNPATVRVSSELETLRAQLADMTAQRDMWKKRADSAADTLGHNRKATNACGQQVVVMRLRMNRLAHLAVAVANGGTPEARGMLLDYLTKCGYPTAAWTDPLHERSTS